nr:IS110 family transposase [Bradyrhizobium sp. 2S1]MCK7664741.1 IS110 family transposase [Bradyrhizobium sp. 2S1]
MTLKSHATVIAVQGRTQPRRHGEVSLLSADDDSDAIDPVKSFFLPAPLDFGTSSTIVITRHTFNNVIDGTDFGTDFGADTSPPPPAATGPKHFPRLGLIVGDADDKGQSKLRNDPAVVEVVHGYDPKMICDIQLLEDPAPQRTWSVDFLRIPELWAKGFSGKGISVGHLDSGLDGSHPALKPALRQFAAIDETGTADESATASDNHGHGTHTAGILCARQIDGVTVGIAPDAALFSGQITGERSLMRMLGGLEWLLGKKVRLLSLSAGVEPFNPVFQTVVERLRAANVLPIVSIGNDSAGTSFSPGNYATALGVGSINQQSDVAQTEAINALRGHLAEYGVIMAKGTAHVGELVERAMDPKTNVPEAARFVLDILIKTMVTLEMQIKKLDSEITHRARKEKDARRLMTIPGVGPMTATALLALAPAAGSFRCGRDFAAWLGLTPLQRSTGGKQKLGATSKMGERTLRRLLIIGATAVVQQARRRGTSPSSWLGRMIARKPPMLVATALANKMARVWALMANGGVYKAPAVAA